MASHWHLLRGAWLSPFFSHFKENIKILRDAKQTHLITKKNIIPSLQKIEQISHSNHLRDSDEAVLVNLSKDTNFMFVSTSIVVYFTYFSTLNSRETYYSRRQWGGSGIRTGRVIIAKEKGQ